MKLTKLNPEQLRIQIKNQIKEDIKNNQTKIISNNIEKDIFKTNKTTRKILDNIIPKKLHKNKTNENLDERRLSTIVIFLFL